MLKSWSFGLHTEEGVEYDGYCVSIPPIDSGIRKTSFVIGRPGIHVEQLQAFNEESIRSVMRGIVKNAMLNLTRTRFLNATTVYCFSCNNAIISHGIGTRRISTASNEEEEGDTATTAPTPLTGKKPLFTEAASLSELTRKDINTYITISEEDLKHSIGEGLPAGLTKEYEETKGSSLLVRASFLELRDELKACVEKVKNPNAQVRNPRKQFILDGPVSSGKSITLAMLVHWARSEGWFVFYVPNGKEWTHGGFYYKNPVAPTWDTPRQAITVLERLLKSHETNLKQLPCQVFEPITLGEGPGIGMLKDAEVVAMPEGSTLYDLVQTGLTCSHAAVGVVVRLREELPLVKEVPVLFVIDQFNSWFTFSQYKEYTGRFSHRDIHARELTMVKPYRSMLHNDMMVAAYSHSTAVGKLRKHLPDTPQHVRYDFPRYSIDEAEAVIDYYSRQKLISDERLSEDKWKRIFYLANGNGSEIRNLVRFI